MACRIARGTNHHWPIGGQVACGEHYKTKPTPAKSNKQKAESAAPNNSTACQGGKHSGFIFQFESVRDRPGDGEVGSGTIPNLAALASQLCWKGFGFIK
jgi:hypothetical protein